MAEHFSVRGILRTRELPDPDWTPEQFRYWWCDEKNSSGRVIRPARMSQKEKSHYTVMEAENLITTAGRTQLLTYLGESAGTAILIFKFFAVGTGTISSVSPSDTSLSTELFRLAPTGTSITGTQQDVSILFSTAQGNGTYTNAGVFGNAATSTSGSGTLYTHVLYSYTKTSANAVTHDYLFILQFA